MAGDASTSTCCVLLYCICLSYPEQNAYKFQPQTMQTPRLPHRLDAIIFTF